MNSPPGSAVEASPAELFGDLILFVGGTAATVAVLIASVTLAIVRRTMAFSAGMVIGAGIGIAAGMVSWAHAI
jgi:hypothetical protein